ncbi:MAG: RNA polymerase sigma factor [Clostridia bacterium]|nr:RNA polymerase sigma factor [Clostridia bacterium]
MTEHYKYLYSYVLSRVSDFHDAEDIVQETYLTALQKRDDFRGESHIRTWLCGIAENKIRQHIRRRGIALSRHAEAEEEIPESDPDRLIAAEELEMLRKSVADLPPELRECAVVSILCGMDGRDAAEILGVPVQVVYNRVHRIKKLLRGKLEDHMETSLEIFSSLLNEGMTAVERTAAHFRQFYDLCDARDSEGAARLLLTSPVFASDSAMAHFMIMQQCDMAVRVMRLGKDDPVTRQLASLGAQEFRLAQKLGLCGILDDDTGEELPEHFFYDCAAQFFGAVGDFDMAREMCDQSKALGNPSDMKYAVILEDAGRLTEALEVLENEAMRDGITPYDKCFAYNHIANCHKKLGNTALELKYFLLVYETVKAGGVIEDKEAFAHFHAGDAYAVAMTYAKMGKKPEMMRYLAEAVGINPQYADWARGQAVFAPYREDADFVKLCGTGEGKMFSIR